MDPDWKRWVEAELRAALQDRATGREGRARVRCRRAAGRILEEYFRRVGIPDVWGQNALRRLEFAQTLPHLPSPVQQALRHLTQRVDENFHLPPHIDLVQDVILLARFLLHEDVSPRNARSF